MSRAGDTGKYATMVVDGEGVRLEITEMGEVIPISFVEDVLAMCDRGEMPSAEMRARFDRALLALAEEITDGTLRVAP